MLVLGFIKIKKNSNWLESARICEFIHSTKRIFRLAYELTAIQKQLMSLRWDWEFRYWNWIIFLWLNFFLSEFICTKLLGHFYWPKKYAKICFNFRRNKKGIASFFRSFSGNAFRLRNSKGNSSSSFFLFYLIIVFIVLLKETAYLYMKKIKNYI